MCCKLDDLLAKIIPRFLRKVLAKSISSVLRNDLTYLLRSLDY